MTYRASLQRLLSRIERTTIFPSTKVTLFDSVRYIRKGQKKLSMNRTKWSNDESLANTQRN